jgi:type I restriction enzyme S subunit
MASESQITEVVDFNPPRQIKRGAVAPFVEMAALPEHQRDISYITEREFTGGGSRFRNGDTLFARITPCLENGKTAKVSTLPNGAIAHGSTEFIVMAAKAPEYDEDYVYYLARHPEFRAFAEARMEGTSGRQRVSWQALSEFLFAFPPPDQRKTIGSVLRKIDDKLDLNRRINQTLEVMAQAVFKSWFVDFDPVKAKIVAIQEGRDPLRAAMIAISGKPDAELDTLPPEQYAQLAATAALFPDEMHGSELGDIPSGWRVDTIGNQVSVVDFVANGSFASLKENVSLRSVRDFALYVRTTDFNSGFSGDFRYVDERAYRFLTKSSLDGSEVIISNVGDVGTVFLPPKWLGLPMTLGSNAIALKSNTTHFFYFHFLGHKGKSDIQSIITGSAQMKFNKTNFRSLKVLVPDVTLLARFEKFAGRLFSQINCYQVESRSLSDLRDILLPKLLSGELAVAEVMVEAGA